MPGGRAKGLRDAIQVLKEYHASKAPQKGFFSTLDEAIQTAPFENAPIEQWAGYLKPGRMVRRGEMQFPLKQEELDFANLTKFFNEHAGETGRNINKEGVLTFVRRHRPSFSLTVGDDTLGFEHADRLAAVGRFGEIEERLSQLADTTLPRGQQRIRIKPPRFGPNWDLEADVDDAGRLSHQSPGSSYQESISRTSGVNYPRQHFDPDAFSHSRTTSHATPDYGNVRLVEEIQSDLHQDATDRRVDFDWLKLLTPEEEARRAQLENLIVDGTLDQRGPAQEEFERLREVARGRTPRRGYLTPELDREFDEMLERREPAVEAMREADDVGQDVWIDEIEEKYNWSMDDEQRYHDLRERLRQAVPNAPFKSPAEYGRLELRKQLLNAVNDGESYLAITPSSVQIDRYSLTGRRAENMRRVYDQVYRGELEKLAKQYGTEVVEVPISLKTTQDARPEVMRNVNLETADELEEYMNGGMLQDGLNELLSDTSYVDSAMREMREILSETNVPQAEYHRVMQNMQNVLESTGIKWDADKQEAVGTTRVDRDGNTVYSAASGARNVTDDERQLWESTMAWVANHVRGWMNQPAQRARGSHVRSFPALKITDEVRRRVRESGVPLWSVGAGAAGLETLRQDAEELGAEPSTDRIGFAKGGTVRRSLRGLLKGDDGKPLRLYRGVRGNTEEGLSDEALAGNPRPDAFNASFFSSSPQVAATFGQPYHSIFPREVGVTVPVYVEADEIIDFPVKDGMFDKFLFDKTAANLKPGQVLRARQAYEAGPRALLETDPDRLWSYPSDTYAVGPGTKIVNGVVKKAKGGAVKRVLREVFDAEKGAGATPNNADIEYRGFETEMPIWKYLHLAKHLREPRAGSMDYLKKHIEGGGTIGQPRLTVRWMPEEERWQVLDHDGRHRAKTLAEIYGDDATIPVHVIPEGEMRARDIAPYMRGAPFLGEQWKDTAERDPMNIRPMLKGFKKGGYASEKQARLMRAVAHGWKPSRIKGPSRKVAREFVDKKDRKAEGGLTDVQAAMATHRAPPQRQEPRDRRLLDRLWASFEEQWSGMDPRGNLRGAIYHDWEAPKDEWEWNAEAQMLLPPQRGVRPGIVNDMLSLPALIDDIGDVTQALDLPFAYDTELREIPAIGEAERQMGETSQAIMDKYALDEPQGLLEHGATAGGMMAAQVPVPLGLPSKAAGAGRRALRKFVGSPLEFFSPIVDPSLGSYASGTLFGAGLGEFGDDVFGTAVKMFAEDPEAAGEALKELPDDLQSQILEHLLAAQLNLGQ